MPTPLSAVDPNSQPTGLAPLGVSPGKLGPLPTSSTPDQSKYNFALPAASAPTPAAPLQSTSDIPTPGAHSFDINSFLADTNTAPAKPSILGGFARGLGDIVLQPARALSQLGKFIGTLGLTPEQKAKVDAFYGPGLQERVLGSTYAEPTPTTGEQAAGIALKAAGNLAVPFATNPLTMGLQGAAMGAGQAMENNKSAGSVALEAGLTGVGSAILGHILNVGGAVVGRGLSAAAPEIQKAFMPIADKLGPLLTGTTRQEFDTAFKEAPHILVDYINTVKDAGSPAEAEGVLQGKLLSNVQAIASAAKTKEGAAFQTALDTFKTAHPDVTVDIHAAGQKLIDRGLGEFGHPINADETAALETVKKIIQQPREYSVDGARTLLQDLYAVSQRLESGSPAERLATQAWADVRSELTKATASVDGGALDAAMARYSNFKDVTAQLKPINAANEDTARAFVRNLAGTNKTASREALVELQKMAGDGAPEATQSIQIYNLMKRLVATGKITGSRVQDVMVSGGAVAGLGALGSLFGPVGATVGHTLGSLLAIKTMAPSTITSVMLSEFKAAGIPVTNAIRGALEQAIKNPTLRQAIIDETVNAVDPVNPKPAQ